MRELSPKLEAAQQAASLEPAIKITLSKAGADDVVLEWNRLRKLIRIEEPYRINAKEAEFDNSDGFFTQKDLQGYKAVISWGLVTKAGKEYSPTSPLRVTWQQFNTMPGRLSCLLTMLGIPDLMDEDEASEDYIPDETDTKTVKTLINQIAGATLACYSHCTAYEVVWESGYDTLANTYKPKDSFRIYIGGSRLAAIKRLMEYTGNVPRYGADGKIHILKPVTTGTDYDYEYSLESGHVFLSKAYRKSLILPNRIVVKSQKDDDPQYSSEATSPASYALLPKTKYIRTRLESNAQAKSIAEAVIFNLELRGEAGAAEALMNCGAELFDYVKVNAFNTQDVYRVGNIGSLTLTCIPEKRIYNMRFGFGDPPTVRHIKELYQSIKSEAGGGIFERLYAKDAYIENLSIDQINAYWLDPDSNIDLSKIGDTLDSLPDGETYARTRWMHLDAETGLTMQENMVYYIRFSPDSDEKTIRRGNSPPSVKSTGDYWIDTSGASPIIKRWTGSIWFTIGQDEIDALNKGILTLHTKQSSLSVDGLVLLDKVQQGDYGLVKSTSISAGRIKLDEVETGIYGLVKSTDISAGHIKLDTTIPGTYGLVRSTEISAGYIKLTTDQNLAAQGIEIVSSSSSTRIRINENRIAGYNAGVLQFELKATDGRAYAGAGAVILGDFGIRVTGEYLRFYYGTTSYGSITSESTGIAIQAPARTIRLSGADVAILANYIRPAFTLDSDLGLASKIWNSGFIRNLRPGAHEVGTVGYSNEAYNSVVAKYLYSDDGSVGSYQKYDDIALLKAIKSRKNKEGKDVLDASSLPPELYIENEQGQRYVNVAGLAGLNLGIQRALLARIEALEAR